MGLVIVLLIFDDNVRKSPRFWKPWEHTPSIVIEGWPSLRVDFKFLLPNMQSIIFSFPLILMLWTLFASKMDETLIICTDTVTKLHTLQRKLPWWKYVVWFFFLNTCFLKTFGFNRDNQDANFVFSDNGRSSFSAPCKPFVFIRPRQDRYTPMWNQWYTLRE